MKKVALYFGSFNPIHIGHIKIAETTIKKNIVDEIWWIISPQSPHKINQNMASIENRVRWVKKSVSHNFQFRISEIEINMPSPNYTIYTLEKLYNMFPKITFYILMGSDNYQNINTWKDWEKIKKLCKFIIYNRIKTMQKTNNDYILIDAPLLNISSSKIRENIRLKKNIGKFVSKNIIEEVINNYSLEKNIDT